jgi:hypothetical protein
MQAAVLEDPTWTEDAVATIDSISRSQEYVNADDLRKEMRTPPHSGCFGAAFREAARQGFIESVDFRISSAKTRHRGRHQQWRRKSEGVGK